MGRRAKLTLADIENAGLSLLDENGASGLSIRTLATKLGCAPMTLYNYVATREELDILLVECALRGIATPPADSGTWESQIRILALDMWEHIHRHPNIVPLLLTRRSQSPTLLRSSEALLHSLRVPCADDRQRLHAFRAVSAVIIGMAQNDLAGPIPSTAGQAKSDTIAHIQQLDPDRYPALIAITGPAEESSAKEEFIAALEIVIRGIS